VGTFGILILIFSFVSYRSPRVRPAIQGIPVVVVRDGAPVERAMAYERITLEEIKDAARGQGIADLREIHLGILEPGGTFSFLRASDGGAGQG